MAWITAANDFGVYDLRYADRGSNVRSKGIDGFTPLGPRLIAARAVDLSAIHLRTWVNGDLAQNAWPAKDMLFGFGDIVADLSRLITLEPGDVILTGTPTGSTVVNPGDVVEVEVSAGDQSSGRLRSPIVEADYRLDFSGAPSAMPRADAAARSAAYGASGEAARGIRGEPANQPQALLAGLREVSTATLAALLRKRGLNGLTLDGLRSTWPGARMAGYARTVRYLPLREDLFAAYGGGMNAQKRAIEDLRPGEVLVIEARGDPTAGTIGDILALRAQVRGAAGVVTDGAIRDSAALARLEIPIYHAAVHPAVLGRRHVPRETGVTGGLRRGHDPGPATSSSATPTAWSCSRRASPPRCWPRRRNRNARTSSSPPASPWASLSMASTRSATPACPTTKPGRPPTASHASCARHITSRSGRAG